jgi:hypothetical protein
MALAASQAGGQSGQVSGMVTAGATSAGMGGRSPASVATQSLSAAPGVGEQSPPGSSVPGRDPHAGASNAFEQTIAQEQAGYAGVTAGPPSTSGSSTSSPASQTRPTLPASSGANQLHVLGHDDLGPRLQWEGDGKTGGGRGA